MVIDYIRIQFDDKNILNIVHYIPIFTTGHSITGQAPTPEQGPMKATPSMLRCSHIMRMQRDIHPTILSSLEGVVDQVFGYVCVLLCLNFISIYCFL